MTLIEMVRKARKDGHRWVAVDNDSCACSYRNKPLIGELYFYSECGREFSLWGRYKLTCNWKDSLIDITKLKGIK